MIDIGQSYEDRKLPVVKVRDQLILVQRGLLLTLGCNCHHRSLHRNCFLVQYLHAVRHHFNKGGPNAMNLAENN